MNMNLHIILMLVVGAVVFLIACRQLVRQALSGILLKVLGSLILLLLSLLLVMGGLDLMSYHRILDEQQVATVRFQQLQPQRYEAVIEDAQGQEYHYYLLGDDWQLDARIIRWHPTLAALGFVNNYRLDRLSGRYKDITRELSGERTVFQLTKSASPLDLWTLVQKLPKLGSWIDARYGSATYLPMSDGAAYKVSLGYSGLVAKPLNPEAVNAVGKWEQKLPAND